MNSIIISPHCDDALLSLGGLLINKVLVPEVVVNVFTKTNWTINGNEEVDKITGLRIKEDLQSFASLGINTKYLGFMDASLRKGCENKSSKYVEITHEPIIDPICGKLFGVIKNLIKEYKNVENWFFPLGVGGHIDHCILRDVAIKGELTNQKYVYFYEDVGYDDTESDEKIQAIIKTLPLHLTPKTYKYQNINKKLNILENYASQINRSLLAQVKRTYKKRGGERIWGKSGNIINFLQ